MAMKDPPHPGESLRHDCLKPLGLSITRATKLLGMPVWGLNRILYGTRGITPEDAIRLEKAFGGTAEGWLAIQAAWDLAQARKSEHLIKVKRYVPKKTPLPPPSIVTTASRGVAEDAADEASGQSNKHAALVK